MSMYVQIGRDLGRPAEVVEDKTGELILILKGGLVTAPPLAKAMNALLQDVTTYDSARAKWMLAPCNYREAATALGVGWRWLQRQVEIDPTFPHTRVGSHTAFLGEHIEEIRARFACGELRHANGRPPGRKVS